jgi:SOS-response transcriptional repressor LexA
MPPLPKLTAKQKKLFRFIRYTIKWKGWFPSYDTIRVYMGWANRASAHEMVSQLIKKGRLRQTRRGINNIFLIRD